MNKNQPIYENNNNNFQYCKLKKSLFLQGKKILYLFIRYPKLFPIHCLTSFEFITNNKNFIFRQYK